MRPGRTLRVVLLAGFLAVAAGVVGCTSARDPWEGAGRPRVLVTFPPLYCFVKNVAGEHATIKCLCTKTGPHHYEFDVKDTLLLRQADLFLANGLALDDAFADKMQVQGQNPRLRYVKVGNQLPRSLLLAADHEHEHEPGHEGHAHEHGEHDPHVWLGIPQAVAMVRVIAGELKKVAPEHAADYERNAEAYVQTLEKLQADGRKALAGVKDRKLVSFHESLRYFARTYDLKVVAAIEQGPGDEPSAANLAKLVGIIKKDQVPVIAVEPQYPRTTSAQTLQKELRDKGAAVELVEVDPLETAEPSDLEGKAAATWYERKIRADLGNLKRGFGVKEGE